MKFIIARDEGALTVVPDHPEVRDFLTLRYREMVKKGRKTVFENRKAPMYNLTSVQGGKAALQSHQGFWKSLANNLRLSGHEVVVQDVRIPILEEPNLRAAMVGLRPWQKPWIMQALEDGNSGLLGAPTRFGKSYGMTAICRAFPGALTVVTAPGVDLCRQLLDHFKEVLPHREVKGVFTGSRNSKQSEDITVCSIDSLEKMDHDATELLIVDEPHASVSDERAPRVARFTKARKYGFGATLKGRFDQKDRLIEGILGPVISNVTYKEAVEQGAISPLKVMIIEIPFSKDTIPGTGVDRDVVYKRLLTESSRAAALVNKIFHDVIPTEWQTMAFIQNERQALYYLEKAIIPAEELQEFENDFSNYQAVMSAEREAWNLRDRQGDEPIALTREGYLEKWAAERQGTIAMAKRMKAKERKAKTQAIADGDIWRVLASNIYVQGLTFPDLKVVVNLAGGGATTTAIQKPGRLLQTRPNKNYGVMIDFMFKCRDEHMETRSNPPYGGIVGEGYARLKAYREIGYDIVFVKDSDHAREVILGAYGNGNESSLEPLGNSG